ncbi:MAG: serine hydrolase [Clostridiales bacterium]|nr:serine hydrolase [Clostridiales bacterium]
MCDSFISIIKAEAQLAPMYAAAVITGAGTEYWRNPQCNSANNSHSVTKAFIAAAVGALRDDGRLSLEDKITSFFTAEEMPENMDTRWREVTVEHALQHKTGLDTIPYDVDADDSTTVIGRDYLKYVFSLPIEHVPGEYRRYSDAAYYLLSRVIAEASGMTADRFLRERFFVPLQFREWAMSCCPCGHAIGGGGFYSRADDVAKLGFMYACGGVYEGNRMISQNWIDISVKNDYAFAPFRDTDVFVKTGAYGQMIAFSIRKRTATAWHGFSKQNGNDRNDRLLEAFVKCLDKK